MELTIKMYFLFQKGWLDNICPEDSSTSKHHKKTHKGHHKINIPYTFLHPPFERKDHPADNNYQHTAVVIPTLPLQQGNKRMSLIEKENLLKHSRKQRFKRAIISKAQDMRAKHVMNPRSLSVDDIEEMLRNYKDSPRGSRMVDDTAFEEDQLKVTEELVADGTATHSSNLNNKTDEDSEIPMEGSDTKVTEVSQESALTSKHDSHAEEATQGHSSSTDDLKKADVERGSEDESVADDHRNIKENQQNAVVMEDREEMGPLLVEGAATESVFLEAAKAEESVDETLPEEVVVNLLEHAHDGHQETQAELNAITKQHLIAFPEVPTGAQPDSTPRLLAAAKPPGGEGSGPVNIDPSTEENEIKDDPVKPGNKPGKTEAQKAIVFPMFDDEPKPAENEATADDGAGVISPAGTGDIQNDAPQTTNEPEVTLLDEMSDQGDDSTESETSKEKTEEENNTDEEKMTEKQDSEKMAENPEVEDTTESPDMEVMEDATEMPDVEEISEMTDMKDTPEKPDKEDFAEPKSENEDMAEQADVVGMPRQPAMTDKPAMDKKPAEEDMTAKSDMGNPTEKPDDGDSAAKPDAEDISPKPNMKEKTDTPGTQASNTQPTDEDPGSPTSVSPQDEKTAQPGQNTSGDQSKEKGKLALISQILQGIFG